MRYRVRMEAHANDGISASLKSCSKKQNDGCSGPIHRNLLLAIRVANALGRGPRHSNSHIVEFCTRVIQVPQQVDISLIRNTENDSVAPAHFLQISLL